MKQKEITNYLRLTYPENNASGFDVGKIGLQFGSELKDIKKVLIALDGTTEVVDEAIQLGCDLLITHHPFMFSPMLSLNYDSPFGKKIIKVIENRLNLYSMHTNFDVANDGMNDILANALELENIAATKDVIDSECFLRIGEIQPMKLDDYAKIVMNRLNEEACRVIGDSQKIIKRVGVVGGSGTSELRLAKLYGCDTLITGEVRHNNALDVIDDDFSVIEVSHAVEGLFKETLKDKLQNEFPDVKFMTSKKEIKPYRVINQK